MFGKWTATLQTDRQTANLNYEMSTMWKTKPSVTPQKTSGKFKFTERGHWTLNPALCMNNSMKKYVLYTITVITNILVIIRYILAIIKLFLLYLLRHYKVK